MADAKGLSILMSMKDVGVERSLKQIKAQFKTLSSEMSRSNANFKNTERSMESMSSRAKELRKGIDVTENSMKDIVNQLKKMSDEERRSSVEAEKLRLEYSRQNKALNMYQRQLKQTENDMNQFGSSTKRTVFSMEKIENVLGTLRKQLNITNMAFERGEQSTKNYQSYLNALNTVIEKHKRTIQTLETRYQHVARQQGVNSKEAIDLRQKILQEKQSLDTLEGQYRQTAAQAQRFAMEQKTATMSMSQIRQKITQVAQSLKISANNFKLSGQTASAYKAKIESLNNGMKQQQLIVQNLSRQYDYAKRQYGATSKEAQQLGVQLSEERLKLKSLGQELNQTTQAHKRLKMEQQLGISSMSQIRNKMTDMNNALALSRSNFSRAGESVQGYKTHLMTLKTTMTQQKTVLRELQAQYDFVAQSQGKNSQEARELASAITQQKIKMNELETEIEQTGQAYKELSVKQANAQRLGATGFGRSIQSVNKYKDTINNAGMAMRNVGSNMSMYVTLPVIAGFGAAIKTGMEFESQMAKVGAIAGANKQELKAMTDQAVDLGAKTVFSASEVANGMQELSALGFDAKQTMSAIPGVIDAAAASGADMATTATIMASTMNAFGLEASKSGHIADVLAMSANKSAADVSYMGEALKYAGTPAHSLGISLEDTSSAIMAMSNAGLKGEQAGTTLRASLIKLAKPTKASQKAMDELGVSLTDSKGKFVGMPALIGQFKNGLQGMTKEQKLAAVSQIVGTESASGFLALIDAGPNKLKKYSQELKNSNGASKEAADKMNNTLKGAIEQLGGAFESLSIKITQSNNGPLTALVKALGNIVEWFSKLPGPVLQMLTIFAGLTATIGPLLIMIGATANGITGIASAVTLLNGTKGGAAFFSIFKGGLGSILPNIGQLLTKIPILGGVFSVLGGALGAISAPVWIVIGAVAALGAAFVIAYKKSETFRNIVNTVINPVKNAIISLWNGIKAFATGIKNVFSGDTAGGFNIFKKLLPKEAATQLTSTLLMIRGAFREFFTFIRTTAAVFGAAMSAFWKQHGSTIINTFNAIKAAVGVILGFLFNNIIKPILAGIGNHFRIIFGGLKAIVINVFTGIRMVVQGGLTAINGIINIFKGLFTGNFRLMWQGIKQVFSGALTAIGGMLRLTFGNLLIFIKTIGLMMLNSFKTIWTIIKNVVVGLAKALAFSVRATITALKTVLIAIFTALSVAARNIWNGLKNAVLSIVRALISGIRALFNGLKAALTNIWNGIKAISLRVWNAIKNGVIAIVRAYVNTVKAIFNALKNAISSIFNSIKSFFIRVWTTIKNSVVSIVRSLYNNLRNHFNNLKNIIRSIFTAIKSFLYSIWTSIKNKLSQIVQNIRDSVANKFNSLKRAVVDITSKLKGYIVNAWGTIKSKVVGLAQGLKDKVMGTFNKMKDGLSNIIGKIKGFINDMVDKVKGGLNNLIKGVNWVAGKIGMDPIPKLKLSTGTESTHTQNYVTNGKINRDTLATVGDKGRGNGPGGFRHEMIRYPNGKTAITPNRDTTAYLPKGSTVYNGAQTHAILRNRNNIPKFAKGTLWDKAKKTGSGIINGIGDGAKHVGMKAVNTAKNVAKGAFDAIGDVMDYMDNPGKLVDKVLSAAGVNFDFLKGDILGGLMKAMYKKLKTGVKNLFDGWLEEGGGADLSSFDKYPKTTPYSPNAPVPGYGFNGGRHYGIDYGTPVGTTLKAPTSGTVSRMSDHGGGLVAKLLSGKFTQFFLHLSSILKTGKVKQGEAFAKTGNSGAWTTGPHLHYQVEKGNSPFITNRNTIDPEKFASMASGGKSEGKQAPSAWRSTIIKAAKRMKVNPTNAQINGIIAQIQRESGGDAGITQSTAVRDINAITGNLARGLLQYVPSTFDAYKVKGHGNITSGYDQLLAFFNNSNWANDIQYGRSGWGPRGSRRFATGGLINASGWYNLAEEGHGEYIVPRDPRRASDAMKIIALASNEIQGNKKGNKKPGQLPNINNNGTDNTELLLRMIENQQVQISQQQEQMNALMLIARKDFKPSIDKYAHKQQVYSAIDDYNRQKERKSRF